MVEVWLESIGRKHDFHHSRNTFCQFARNFPKFSPKGTYIAEKSSKFAIEWCVPLRWVTGSKCLFNRKSFANGHFSHNEAARNITNGTIVFAVVDLVGVDEVLELLGVNLGKIFFLIFKILNLNFIIFI